MVVKTEKLLNSKTVYDGRILDLHIDSIELPSGRQTTREIIHHRNSVAIVAVDAENKVFLVRQYRSPLQQMLIEIPAGKTEQGESAVEAARRELIEETGYSAAKMEDLGGFYASPGYSTEYLHLFHATDLQPVEGDLDEDEIAEVSHVPISEIPGMIANGEICDGKSVAGLLRVIYGIR